MSRLRIITKIKNKVLGNKEHSVFSNMLILFLGTGFFKAISLIIMPFLTRIYQPEDFGLLSIYVSIVVICGPLLSLRYQKAISLPKHDSEAVNIIALCAMLILFFITCLSILMFFFDTEIFQFFGAEKLAPYSWLVIIGILANSGFNVISSWGIRKKNFKAIAKIQATQGTIGNVLKLGLGLLALKPIGLILGQVMIPVTGVVALSFTFSKEIKKNIRKVSVRRILYTLKRYKDFPKFYLLSTFLNTLAAQLPILFITAWYGVEEAGQFGLTVAVLSSTLVLLSMSGGRAYFGEISVIGKGNPKKIRRVTISVMKRLAVIAIIVSAFLLAFAPFAFSYLFGETWLQAGVYARILAIFLGFQFVCAPISNLFLLYNKHRLSLLLHMFRLCLVISTFMLGHYLNLGSEKTLLLFSASIAFYFNLYIFFIFRVLNGAYLEKG